VPRRILDLLIADPAFHRLAAPAILRDG